MKDLIHICFEAKAQATASLLLGVVSALNTPISYHTEVFVKTEVGCTIHFLSQNTTFPYSLVIYVISQSSSTVFLERKALVKVFITFKIKPFFAFS